MPPKSQFKPRRSNRQQGLSPSPLTISDADSAQPAPPQPNPSRPVTTQQPTPSLQQGHDMVHASTMSYDRAQFIPNRVSPAPLFLPHAMAHNTQPSAYQQSSHPRHDMAHNSTVHNLSDPARNTTSTNSVLQQAEAILQEGVNLPLLRRRGDINPIHPHQSLLTQCILIWDPQSVRILSHQSIIFRFHRQNIIRKWEMLLISSHPRRQHSKNRMQHFTNFSKIIKSCNIL